MTIKQPIEERGYDHPVDRILGGDVCRADNGLWNDGQKTTIQEYLRNTPIEPDLVIRLMGSIVLDRMTEQDRWEIHSLEAMGVNFSDRTDARAAEYINLAGSPDKLPDFIGWFDEQSAGGIRPLVRTIEGIIDHEGNMLRKEFIEGSKGVALSIGSSVQFGDWGRSDMLDTTVDTALAQLSTNPDNDVQVLDPRKSPKRYAVGFAWEPSHPDSKNILETFRNKANHLPAPRIVEQSEVPASELLHLVRERAYADISRNSLLHIIKRNEAVVPVANLPVEFMRQLVNALTCGATNDKSIGALGALFEREIYEWRFTRPVGSNRLGILPAMTTYFVRNPQSRSDVIIKV